MSIPNLDSYPLCRSFLSGYLSMRDDPKNFPPGEFPHLLERYEKIFQSALQTLGLKPEELRSRSEFRFDSGNAANLEGGIAILRVVEALRLENFLDIALVKTKKGKPGADITCEKEGQKICLEVKAITKQSSGRAGLFLEDQLYEKILENLPKARMQLDATASELQCSLKFFTCVLNWFDQSIYLGQSQYQQIVDRLERDGNQESLKGVDGILFVTKMGQRFLFLNERAKVVDR
ncbi:MAG TPA: hypothetical protein VK706_06475 [Candidatus Sulfotelmatobacter sp.]|jgi:hypothetical protein|nr:hypothetical protein [Candidatus Sulfotelmatobacter sp.]